MSNLLESLEIAWRAAELEAAAAHTEFNTARLYMVSLAERCQNAERVVTESYAAFCLERNEDHP
jgi:hypothetical protein